MSPILLALGGLGLFLIGMQVLTDGLRGLAGAALRRLLVRFTRTPASGAVTGAITTAIIQSSSATTVTAVGFVGAGLLTFPQALGIIFGANIGTTITGWLVALVGFKLQLTQIVMPMVLIGAFLKLFGYGRLKSLGWALAGFSLLFIGIDALQQGMAAYEGAVTPETFPEDTVLGRLQLVLLGILITIVTQSSSAGVATALVALGAGAISFPQAAALVIGMDVGTTFTAAIATLGGSTATRRTGFAHVIYNCLTGAMAFALLTPYTAVVSAWTTFESPGDAQVAVVGFHTLFNALGVLLVIGFIHQFATLIERMIPERGPSLVAHLNDNLLSDSSSALDAVQGTTQMISKALFRLVADALRSGSSRQENTARAIGEALDSTYSYLSRVRSLTDKDGDHDRYQTLLHLLDHLTRLAARCKQNDRIRSLQRIDSLANERIDLISALHTVQCEDVQAEQVERLNDLRKRFRERRHTFRETTFEAAVEGGFDSDVTSVRVDGVRWLHRSAYHIWRIGFHLSHLNNAGGLITASASGRLQELAEEDEEDEEDEDIAQLI